MHDMPLPFIVENCPTTGTECVACYNFRPAEQLAPCLCGSPICDCGIPCSVCAELFAIYDASMARYKAKHIHLVGETNPCDLKTQVIHKEELVRALEHPGCLN